MNDWIQVTRREQVEAQETVPGQTYGTRTGIEVARDGDVLVRVRSSEGEPWSTFLMDSERFEIAFVTPELPPYSEWSDDELRSELDARELTSTGRHDTLVKRLEENDEAPKGDDDGDAE